MKGIVIWVVPKMLLKLGVLPNPGAQFWARFSTLNPFRTGKPTHHAVSPRVYLNRIRGAVFYLKDLRVYLNEFKLKTNSQLRSETANK